HGEHGGHGEIRGDSEIRPQYSGLPPCPPWFIVFLVLRIERLMAQILDGKALAQTMQAEIAGRAAEFARKHGFKPGLAAVLVGDDLASQVYVRNKRKACEAAGLESWLH